jgi:hypothetical protein
MDSGTGEGRANQFAATTTRSPPSRTTGRIAAGIVGHATPNGEAEAKHEGFNPHRKRRLLSEQKSLPQVVWGRDVRKMNTDWSHAGNNRLVSHGVNRVNGAWSLFPLTPLTPCESHSFPDSV